jgi:hypothetical protein
MTRLEALIELRDKVRLEVSQRYQNARTDSKEGRGTHRNAGDHGRVAAHWVGAVNELCRIEALIAQEQGGTV